jgi:DNA helicase II / ATP-dependent DNA helicase PcrA
MSKSGFDAVAGRDGDLAPRIFARSTGLSSDPPVNRTCTELDTCLVSNSDAH